MRILLIKLFDLFDKKLFLSNDKIYFMTSKSKKCRFPSKLMPSFLHLNEIKYFSIPPNILVNIIHNIFLKNFNDHPKIM